MIVTYASLSLQVFWEELGLFVRIRSMVDLWLNAQLVVSSAKLVMRKRLHNLSSASTSKIQFTLILKSPIIVKFSNFDAALFHKKFISSKKKIDYYIWEDDIHSFKTTMIFWSNHFGAYWFTNCSFKFLFYFTDFPCFHIIYYYTPLPFAISPSSYFLITYIEPCRQETFNYFCFN